MRVLLQEMGLRAAAVLRAATGEGEGRRRGAAPPVRGRDRVSGTRCGEAMRSMWWREWDVE